MSRSSLFVRCASGIAGEGLLTAPADINAGARSAVDLHRLVPFESLTIVRGTDMAPF